MPWNYSVSKALQGDPGPEAHDALADVEQTLGSKPPTSPQLLKAESQNAWKNIRESAYINPGVVVEPTDEVEPRPEGARLPVELADCAPEGNEPGRVEIGVFLPR